MLRLYDSLLKEIVPLAPADGKTATIYACGPTVYHDVHIGNLRTFLTVDLLRRHLESTGFKVKLVMNLTDVGHMLEDADTGEDKVEKAAAAAGKTPKEIADFYAAAFFRDIEALRIEPAWKYPRATDHVKEMIGLVKKLIKNGKAYVTPKGDVYYDVGSFKDYGKLSGNAPDKLVAGARVEAAPDKRHPADFALWINNPKHIMQWKSPWGPGYPGWHLECSAMAMKYLGETIDLHAGGEDLKFPHHECEIAQSEGATGKPFARHWLHVKYLMVEGEKMSKSKGNFFTLSDLTAKGYSPLAVRYLLLSSHYRTQLNFTLEGLAAAEKTLRSFRETVNKLAVLARGRGRDPETPESAAGLAKIDSGSKGLREAMDDDLNVSLALANVHETTSMLNGALAEGQVGNATASKAMEFFEGAEKIFGFGLLEKTEVEIPPDVANMLAKREEARKSRNWAESDRLRQEIEKRGYSLKDTPEGQKISRA